MNEQFTKIWLWAIYMAGLISGLPIGYALALANGMD